MKKSWLLAGAILILTGAVNFGMAADTGSWTGWIADENCAKDYNKAGTADHADCAKSCLKRGGKLALSTKEGPFLLAMEASEAEQHIGHEVVVKGELDPVTNTIQVSSISMQGHHH